MLTKFTSPCLRPHPHSIAALHMSSLLLHARRHATGWGTSGLKSPRCSTGARTTPSKTGGTRICSHFSTAWGSLTTRAAGTGYELSARANGCAPPLMLVSHNVYIHSSIYPSMRYARAGPAGGGREGRTERVGRRYGRDTETSAVCREERGTERQVPCVGAECVRSGG